MLATVMKLPPQQFVQPPNWYY